MQTLDQDIDNKELTFSADQVASRYYDKEDAPKVKKNIEAILELEDESKATDLLKKLDEGLQKSKVIDKHTMRILTHGKTENIQVIHNLGFSNTEILDMVFLQLKPRGSEEYNFGYMFGELMRAADTNTLSHLLDNLGILKEQFSCFTNKQLGWFYNICKPKPDDIHFLKKNVQILERKLHLTHQDLIKNLGNPRSKMDLVLLRNDSEHLQENLDFYTDIVGFEPQTIVQQLQKGYNLWLKRIVEVEQEMYKVMQRAGLSPEEIRRVLIESKFRIFDSLSSRILPEDGVSEIPVEYISGIKKMILSSDGFKDLDVIDTLIVDGKFHPVLNPEKARKIIRLYHHLGKITPELAKGWLEIDDDQEDTFIAEYEQKKNDILFANADEIDENNSNSILPSNAIYELIQNTYGVESSDVENNMRNLNNRTELPYKAEAKYEINVAQYNQEFSTPISDDAKNIIQTPFKKLDEQPVLFQLLDMYGDFRLSKYISQYSENTDITPSQVKELQEIVSIIPKENEFISFISGLDSSPQNTKKYQQLIKTVREFLLPQSEEINELSDENNLQRSLDISQALEFLSTNDMEQSALDLVKQSSISDVAKDIQFESSMKESVRLSKVQTLKNRLIIQQAKEMLKKGEELEYKNLLPAICNQQGEVYRKKLAQVLSQIKRVKLPDRTITFVPTVSKAGFFAKYSAEICTASNTEMYEKRYHSHLNIIVDNNVVGNVMLYIFNETERPELSNYLVARGFNPSNDFLRTINPTELSDEIVNILTDIAQKNNRTAILVPQQNDWHPLANRDLMVDAVQKICGQCDQSDVENLGLDVNEYGVKTPLQFLKKGI